MPIASKRFFLLGSRSLLQPTFLLRGFGRRGEAAASVDALRALADTVSLRSRSLLLSFADPPGTAGAAREAKGQAARLKRGPAFSSWR